MVTAPTVPVDASAPNTRVAERLGGEHGVFLICYDTEAGDPACTGPFLRRMLEIHEAADVPATLFLCGRTIERNLEALRPLVDHPLIDLQQHTHHHVLLKTVCIEDPQEGTQLVRGGTLEQIREEVRSTSLERAAAERLVFSYCTHDHSSTHHDPRMAITAALLQRARDLGMQCLSYADYYTQRV